LYKDYIKGLQGEGGTNILTKMENSIISLVV